MHQKFVIALRPDGHSDLYLNRRGTWTDEPGDAAWFSKPDDAAGFSRSTRDEIVMLAGSYSGDDGTRAALLMSIDWIDRARVAPAPDADDDAN